MLRGAGKKTRRVLRLRHCTTRASGASSLTRTGLRMLVIAGCVAALSLLARPSPAVAHEVPARVHVTGLIRPDGERLRILLRVPLNAMRDIDFPVRGPGYLDIARADEALRDAAVLWIAGSLRVYEEGDRLAEVRLAVARISLPSDASFASWGTAIAHVLSPVDTLVQLPWEQALLDVLLEYPITSATARFAVEPAFAHLGVRTTTELRFLPPAGEHRVYSFTGDPGLLRLNPAWHHVATNFLGAGARGIIESIPLVLLLTCIVTGCRGRDEVIGLYLPFAVAVGLAILAGSAGLLSDLLWMQALVALLIAVLLLYLALENIAGTTFGRRARLSFAGGLMIGASAWYALAELLPFAAGQDVIALLSYSIAVQTAALFVMATASVLVVRVLPRIARKRIGTIILCAVIAHSAWHWMLTDAEALRAHDPIFSLSHLGWLQLVRGAMLVALCGLVAGLGYVAARRLAPVRTRSSPHVASPHAASPELAVTVQADRGTGGESLDSKRSSGREREAGVR